MRIIHLLLAGLFVLAGCEAPEKEATVPASAPESTIGWNFADSVVLTIKHTNIPLDTFYITQLRDNERNERIQLAIDKVFERGGGTIVIPAGVYYSAPIVLKSNTELHLEKGAELKFIPDPKLYPSVYTWFHGIPCMNYAPMISAQYSSNIKISGEGVIDGQGNDPVWRTMKYYEKADLNLLKELDKGNVEVANRRFGNGHFLRPDLIGLVECSGVSISGVTLINTPLSAVQMIKCDHVVVSDIHINSSGYDQVGVAIESSKMVLVRNLVAERVGDGIKILSGRTEIENNSPSENIFIQNSSFVNHHYSAITVSLASSAGTNRIFMNDLDISDTDAAIKVHVDANMKKPIHDIFIKNCRAKNIWDSFLVGRVYHSKKTAGKPLLYNIHIDQTDVDSCGRAFFLLGHSRNLIYNIGFTHSKFNTYKGSFVEDTKNLNWQNILENGKESSGRWSFGYTKREGIELNNPHVNDVLDTDDIKVSDLPETVKNALSMHYFNIPIDDINRIITKSNVIYEIDFLTETGKNLRILILNDGEIVRVEEEVEFDVLPKVIISALGDFMQVAPVAFMMNKTEKIVLQDLIYYTIEGEYNNLLFALGITETGDIIEKKQRNISFYFSPAK